MKPTIGNTLSRSENLYIIGNGVIAKALAVVLSEKGKNVTILRGSIDGQPAYLENIQVELDDHTIQADITISTLSNHDELDGVILLTNKSFGNHELATKLKLKAKNSPIVFLQNGLHIENSFIDLGFNELYRCLLFVTSQSVTDNKVKFKHVAPSPVGLIKGSVENLHHIVNELNTETFSFVEEPDIQKVIWKKAIINSVFNSICPLLEIDNGVFYRNEAAQKIAKVVIGECVAVANKSGIYLTADEILQSLLALSKMSDGYKISTYQDILNNRETEIETLNFAIVKAAGVLDQVNIPVTALLGQLTKIKSGLSRAC